MRPHLRSVLLALLVSAFALTPALSAPANPKKVTAKVPVAQAMAEHPLRGVDGGTLLLSSLKGQVVVLSFWASWCGPCRKELPRLAALDAELTRLGGRVLAVSIDADARNAADFARRHAPGMSVYLDGPEGLVHTLDVPALPYTFVLDRDGAVVWCGGGADEATFATFGNTARKLSAARATATHSTEGDTR